MQTKSKGLAFLDAGKSEQEKVRGSAVRDYAVRFYDGGLQEGVPETKVTIDDTLVFGVGFHGWVPAGSVLVVLPNSQRSALYAWFAAWVTGEQSLEGFGVLPDDATVLHPGDVVRFNPPMDGITCVTMFPYGMGYGDMVTPTPRMNWPRRGLVRVYTAAAAIQDRLGWKRAPSTQVLVPDPAVPAVVGQGVQVPPETKTVTLAFCDDAIVPARVGALESNTYEIWWMTRDGLWHHNAADDCVAGERGQIDTAHDLERYNVDADIVGLYVRRMGGGAGSVLWVWVTVS